MSQTSLEKELASISLGEEREKKESG